MKLKKRLLLFIVGGVMILSLFTPLLVFATAKQEKAKTANANAEPLFTVSSSRSSVTENATYTATDHESSDLFDAKGNAVVGAGSVTGVQVSLAQNDTFNYTKVIDLTEKTTDNPLFKFAVTPETIGVKDVSTCQIILTDAYDTTNSIIINVDSGNDYNDLSEGRGPGLYNGVSYIRAGFDGTLVAYDNHYKVMRTADGQGSIVFLDFTGAGGNSQRYLNYIGTIDTNNFAIYYDDTEKQLFTSNATDTKNTYFDKGECFVDLDNEEFFSTPWKGFTTGECFLSIKGVGYQQSSFNFVLTEIDGQKVEDISTERDPHTITVDTLGYEENSLPIAKVGEKYFVYEASSLSPYYGKLDVTYEVYFGADKITVGDDRKFLCENEGEYKIIYSADDNHGTVITKELTITAQTGLPDLTVNLGAYDTNFTAGDEFNLPTATVENYIIKYDMTVSVLFDGIKTAVDGDTYLLKKAGKYKFIYEATDLAERKQSAVATVTVEAGDVARFEGEIAVPRYFIGGKTYKLPTAYAYNYTDGSGDKVKTTIYYKDDMHTKVLPTRTVTVPESAIGTEATIIYDAELNGNHTTDEYTVPVLSIKDATGGICADKLFYVVDGEATLTVNSSDVTITATEDAVIDYINELAVNGFTFAFNGSTQFNAFKKISLVLTDSQDSSIAVQFNYEKVGDKTVFYVNDGKKYTLSENLYSDTITLTYNKTSKSVSFSAVSSVNATIANTVGGNVFSGFTSGKVYARLSISEVSGSSKISVKQISNQSIGDMSFGEFANPVFDCTEDYGGIRKIGETIKLPTPIVADAVDPGLSFTVSVTAPNDKMVTAIDGTLLQSANGDSEYEIKLTMYGTYRVYYRATDSSGNTAGFSYIIVVLNDNAPEITLESEVVSQAKKGATVVLPKATGKDDIDGEVTVKVYLMTNQGQTVTLNNGAVTFAETGTYKVFYWCSDSAGNVTCREFTITVTE